MMYALLYTSPTDPYSVHEDLVAVSERVDLLKRYTVEHVANQHQLTVPAFLERLGDPDAEIVWGVDENDNTRLDCEFPDEWDSAFTIIPVTVLD